MGVQVIQHWVTEPISINLDIHVDIFKYFEQLLSILGRIEIIPTLLTI